LMWINFCNIELWENFIGGAER